MLPSCSSFVVYRPSDCLDPVTVFVFNHLKSSLIPIPLRINLLRRSSARSCINMMRFHRCALHAFLISHLAHSQILLILKSYSSSFSMAMTKVFFFDLKAGQCSSVVEARLLRFWQAKNVKRGGELMWMDLLMVDVNVSYSFYHSRYNFFFHIYIYIYIFSLCSLLFVSRIVVISVDLV